MKPRNKIQPLPFVLPALFVCISQSDPVINLEHGYKAGKNRHHHSKQEKCHQCIGIFYLYLADHKCNRASQDYDAKKCENCHNRTVKKISWNG